jgi:eight-cysteine-cluster-containing protein
MKRLGIFFLCCLIWMVSCQTNKAGEATSPAKESIAAAKGFCGISSGGPCKADSECKVGGCSQQVCYAENEGEPITTCEYQDCYNAKAAGVECRCVEQKCQWK